MRTSAAMASTGWWRCCSWCVRLAFAKPPRLTLFITRRRAGQRRAERNRAALQGRLRAALQRGRRTTRPPTTTGGDGHRHRRTPRWSPARGRTATAWWANKVFNRSTGKLEPCFADATHPLLEAPAATSDVSPRRTCCAETLSRSAAAGDAAAGGKAVAIAGKGRAAVAHGRAGSARRGGSTSRSGKFVTGTWYRKEVAHLGEGLQRQEAAPTATTRKRWELLGCRRRTTWATTTGRSSPTATAWAASSPPAQRGADRAGAAVVRARWRRLR